MKVTTGRVAFAAVVAVAVLVPSAGCQREAEPRAAAGTVPETAAPEGSTAAAAPGEAAAAQPEIAGAPADSAPDLAAGWLDGTWVAGGRDRYHLVLTVEGTTATVVGLDGTEHWAGTFTVEPVEGGYHRVRDAAGTFELHAFVRGDDEVVGILFGENGLAEARRVYPTPDALLGSWVVGFSDNYHLAGGAAELRPDSWEVRVGDHAVRSGRLYSLGERAGALQVALQTSPAYMELTNFVRTPADTWLAWVQGTDQHMVFHREGARPPWIPERTPRIPIAGTE